MAMPAARGSVGVWSQVTATAHPAQELVLSPAGLWEGS
jgi:hypothetical protein